MAAPAIRSSEASSRASNSATDTFTAPASIVDGDVLLLLYAKDAGATSLTMPAGFTAVPNTTEVNDGGAVSRAGTKTAASESGNYTGTSSVAERFAGYVAAIQGTSGIDASAQAAQDPGDGSVEAPQVTTTVADCLIVYLIASDDTTGTVSVTPPAGVTTDKQASVSSGAFVYAGYEVQASPGTSTARTFTMNSTQEWVCRTVAFAPVGGGGPNQVLAAASIAATSAVTVAAGAVRPAAVAVAAQSAVTASATVVGPPAAGWTHIGSANAGTTGSVQTQSITFPAGTAAGHLAFLVATVNDNSPATATLDGDPTGWTRLGAGPDNGVNNSFMTSVAYWKVLDAGDITAGQVTVNFNGFRSHELAITVWEAAGTITFDTSAVSKGTADGDPTPATATGVTTASDGELVVIGFTASQSTAVYDFEAGYDVRTSGQHGVRNAAIATAVKDTAGATGDLDASIRNNFFGFVTYVAAFAQDGGGGPTTAAASIAAESAVTVAAGARRSGAATVTALSSLTAAAGARRSGAVTIAAGSAVSVAGVVRRPGAVAITGSSSFQVAAGARRAGAVTVGASSTLAAAGVVRAAAAVSVAATSSVAVTGGARRHGSAAVGAQVAVSAAGVVRAAGQALIAAQANVAVAAAAVRAAQVSVAAESGVTVAAGARVVAQVTIAASSNVTVAVAEAGIIRARASITATSTVTAQAAAIRTAAVSVTSGSSVSVAGLVRRYGQVTVAATSTVDLAGVARRYAQVAVGAVSTVQAAGTGHMVAQVAIAATSTLTVDARFEVAPTAPITGSYCEDGSTGTFQEAVTGSYRETAATGTGRDLASTSSHREPSSTATYREG